MVIIVLPNLRQVLDNFDTNLRQLLLGADARDKQDVWSRNSTTAEDDLAVSPDAILGRYWRLGYFDADRARFRTRFIEQDFFNYGCDGNCEVGTPKDTGRQVSNGDRVACARLVMSRNDGMASLNLRDPLSVTERNVDTPIWPLAVLKSLT